MDLARRRRPTVTIGGVNYLAHAWLARHSDDAILGAILGDFVFGQSGLQDWPPAVRAEIVPMACAVLRRSVNAVSCSRSASLSTSSVLGLPLMITSSCSNSTRLIAMVNISSMNF